MKRKTKKLSKRKRWIEKKSKSSSILPVLFAIGFLSLFSETIRTVPAGAKSENFRNLSFELPSLSSDIFEQKYIKKNLMVDKQSKNYDFLIEENFTIDKELIVAKAVEKQIEKVETKIVNQEIVDVPKVEETIKVASTLKLTQADTSTKTIIIDGEEKIIPGSNDKNITYIQILQNPNDIDLNLKYARQQGKAGNFKQTIATLERLNMLYPDNVEIK